jgi:LEA14-like dessication related protein
MIKFLKNSFIPAISFLLFSCIGEFKEISVTRIDGFKVTKLSAAGIEGEINVTINNPNPMSFKVYRSRATIMYGDMKLGTARIAKKVKIGPNSNSPETFILKGDLKNVSFASLPELLAGRGKQMEIKGHIKAGKWYYKKKFPIDEKQKIPGIDLKGAFPGF